MSDDCVRFMHQQTSQSACTQNKVTQPNGYNMTIHVISIVTVIKLMTGTNLKLLPTDYW